MRTTPTADLPRASTSRRLNWRHRVALVVLGLLLPLGFGECVMRVAAFAVPGDFQTTSFLEAHPEFGRRNRPGAGWKKTAEYTSWVEINSKGLRGPEIDYAKPPGERRILVLGDSFTFAEQVNQDETFVQRLEDRLREELGLAVSVLNGGSNGWATANELVYLAKEGHRFQPDVVVTAFYLGNDVSDNYRRVATMRDAQAADLALRGADAFEGPRRVLRQSMLYTALESGVLVKLPGWQEPTQSDASVRRAPRTQTEAEEAWQITASLLDRTRDVVENRGARYVLMVIPAADVVATGRPRDRSDDGEDNNLDEVLPGFDDPHATLERLAAPLNIATVDLLPAMKRQAARSRTRLYYRQNAHFTAAGHAVAAKELGDFLIERGWLR